MKYVFPVVLMLTIAGCRRVSPNLHHWQTRGNAFSFQVDTRAWSPIPSEHLGRVAVEYIPEAAKELAHAESLEISVLDAERMCPTAGFADTDGLIPFLARGVSYNSSTFSIVKYSKQYNWVYVYQATYNGEMYIPGVRYAPVATPIVIFLERKPARVVPSAVVGGDFVFRGVDFKDTWKEHRK